MKTEKTAILIVAEEVRNDVKTAAAIQRKSMRDFVESALMVAIKKAMGNR